MPKNKNTLANGFTLIEVLIALTITGLIMGGISTAIIQMFSVSDQNTNAITAQRQVQQVGFYVSRDGQTAQTISTGNDPAGTGFPIIFEWTSWDGDEFEITYTLQDGVVGRIERVNSILITSQSIATNITAFGTLFSDTIDPEGVQISPPGDGVYHLTVTANVDGTRPISATRYYEIQQRTR